MKSLPIMVAVVVLAFLTTLAFLPASAGHGPTRQGTDACNGTDGFNVNNMVTRDIVGAIAAQNPAAVKADGTLDRTRITHALLPASGHVAIQVRAAATPIDRVTFEFSAADAGWSSNSTNHPAFLTAIEAREDVVRDADSDLVVGGTFLLTIPSDVVADGNYVARLRALDAGGTEIGRVCIDAIVANGQGPAEALSANSDPSWEPAESNAAGFGFTPQPVLWFPAGEPSASQQGTYAPKDLRIEFFESTGSVKLERLEPDPVDPTLKVFVDRTPLLTADDFSRPHFLAGGRADGTGLEPRGNEKVWGPGFKLAFGAVAGETLPGETLRITAVDAAGKSFCGVYTFQAGPGGSFLASAPSGC